MNRFKNLGLCFLLMLSVMTVSNDVRAASTDLVDLYNRRPAIALSGSDLVSVRQGSDQEDRAALIQQFKDFTTSSASQVSVYAAGTAYSLTATPTALTFGTTSPSVVLTAAGTWKITGRIRYDYNAATFAAVRTTTTKLRRTNNTAADVTNGTASAKTEIVTTLSGTFIDQTFSVNNYVTSNANDAIALFGSIDVVPTAGTLDAVEASITAERLQQ